MRLTVHRGGHQIGGTCVELSTARSRIIIDFGMPLQDAFGADFNERALEGMSLSDLIAKKVLFDIKGLYHDSTPSVDAILISHSHKDHCGLLPYINPQIPVYISNGAYKLMNALNIFLPVSKRTIINSPVILQDKQPVEIGDFTITPYRVDHSGFDSMGFLIRETATGKTVLYSGDFRAGGWTHKRFTDFISNPPKGVDCLLMEGTMIAREGGKYPDEMAVVQGVVEVINKSQNPVIPVYCSGSNIDRIVALYKAVLKTKSLLVIDSYTASMLKAAKSVCDSIPAVGTNNIKVFIENYGHGDIYVNKIRASGQNDFIRRLGVKKIKADKFGQLKQKSLLLMRNTMISVVEKIPQIQGSTLIYSLWDGYIKRDTPDAKKTLDFIKRNNLKKVHIHTSGHATLQILKEFASKINARQIIPIHTEYPERFKEHFGSTVVCYKDGQPFDV